MRIWLITTNLKQGGAERTFLNLSVWLGERGHDVTLILLERMIEYKLPPSISVYFVDSSESGATKGWLGKTLLAWRLRRWEESRSRKHKPDLVISTLPFADEIARRAGLRNVWYRIPNPLSPQISALQGQDARKA